MVMIRSAKYMEMPLFRVVYQHVRSEPFYALHERKLREKIANEYGIDVICAQGPIRITYSRSNTLSGMTTLPMGGYRVW